MLSDYNVLPRSKTGQRSYPLFANVNHVRTYAGLRMVGRSSLLTQCAASSVKMTVKIMSQSYTETLLPFSIERACSFAPLHFVHRRPCHFRKGWAAAQLAYAICDGRNVVVQGLSIAVVYTWRATAVAAIPRASDSGGCRCVAVVELQVLYAVRNRFNVLVQRSLRSTPRLSVDILATSLLSSHGR